MSSPRTRVATRAQRALLLAVCLDTACQAPAEPPFPSNAVPITPPPVYRLWWNLVERCSQLTGDFNAVRFYDEPGQATATAGADTANAYWFAAGNRIVIGALNAFDGPVMRHEMLHALLGPTSGGGHPRLYFVQRCGGIVHCSLSCQTEDGPLPVPAATAPVVAPNELRVSVSVDPPQMDPSQYGGWVAITVAAANPLTEGVWVGIPNASETTGATFGYTIAGNVMDWMPVYEARMGFEAGETQQQMFDLQMAPGMYDPSPGRYDVRGFFATDTTSPASFVVLPASH